MINYKSIVSPKDMVFKLKSEYEPAGDQVYAIKKLIERIGNNEKDSVLLGVTGSGKTFTMANIIHDLQRPAIIMAHNKTLAAQLYAEFCDFFPENAVEYFISYYDYYQPEAYIAKTDTFIEKDSLINEQIDRLRHSTTRSLMERRDTIIISSISSIYGLGSPEFYKSMKVNLLVGDLIEREYIISKLIEMQYKRNDIDFVRGTFRVNGDMIDIFPSYSEDCALRIDLFGNEIDGIFEIDSISGRKHKALDSIILYANSHHVTPANTIRNMVPRILEDLRIQVEYLEKHNKQLEANRLNQRTRYDIEMMLELGSCKGIENYSVYFDNRKIGEPPSTLFDYIQKDTILFVDESHVSIPQIRAMYAGDLSRKTMLVNHGFRLLSALDNRPLKFEEWDTKRPQTIFVSATPSEFELNQVKNNVVEQIIRPTGLLDPVCEVRSAQNQIDDVVKEIQKNIKDNARTIVITLTKKMSESLNEYLQKLGIKCKYIHSDIETLERIKILQSLRKGEINVIIGINLLREGIDIPECKLVAIMDADREGFLRSETSLVQIIGRAARNKDGVVILYADKITKSMQKAMDETERRRGIQIEYNEKNKIQPKTVIKSITNAFDKILKDDLNKFDKPIEEMTIEEIKNKIKFLNNEMKKATHNFEFEKAIEIRSDIKILTLKMTEI